MVDAQVSGTCGGNPVEVRVFSWAPFERITCMRGREWLELAAMNSP